MNRKRLIVVLESEIYIYDISTMKLLHTIETGPNPNGTLTPCLFNNSGMRIIVGLGTILSRLPITLSFLYLPAFHV